MRIEIGSGTEPPIIELARRRLVDWLYAYNTTADAEIQRCALRQIRDLVRLYPILADALPDHVYRVVYRVRAAGTIVPFETDN